MGKENEVELETFIGLGKNGIIAMLTVVLKSVMLHPVWNLCSLRWRSPMWSDNVPLSFYCLLAYIRRELYMDSTLVLHGNFSKMHGNFYEQLKVFSTFVPPKDCLHIFKWLQKDSVITS